MDSQNLNLTSQIIFCYIFHTNDPAFIKKKTKNTNFKTFLLKLLRKNDLRLNETEKTENDPWCLLPQVSQLLIGQNSKVRTVLKT